MGFFVSDLATGFPAMGATGAADSEVADGALYDARMLSNAEKRIAFSSLALGDGMGLTGLGSAVRWVDGTLEVGRFANQDEFVALCDKWRPDDMG